MLAVIIPYYKKTFFQETLRSLANQTNKNFSVYIGNDASPEDPLELIHQFSNELDITYRRFNVNLGQKCLPEHWDRCIDLAGKEEWLMILGDDDYLSNNFVEEFYKNLKDIKVLNLQVVRFASVIVNDLAKMQSNVYLHPKLEKSTNFFYRKFFEKSTRGSLSEQIFSRKAYEINGFRKFPLGWGTDNLAWLEFSNFGNIFTINEAVAYIRMSNENISREYFAEDLKAVAKLQYFQLIVFNYLDYFQKDQRLPLILCLERLTYGYGKMGFKFYTQMSMIYIKEQLVTEFLKFQRRFFLLGLKYKKLVFWIQ